MYTTIRSLRKTLSGKAGQNTILDQEQEDGMKRCGWEKLWLKCPLTKCPIRKVGHTEQHTSVQLVLNTHPVDAAAIVQYGHVCR